MKKDPTSVAVGVPASTSNCGAGFDTLGLALKLRNRVTVSRARSARSITIPARKKDARAGEFVRAAADAFFKAVGMAPEPFRYRIDAKVPPARGLGSSVTIIAGVIAGLNALHRGGLSRRDLVALTTAIEGHPDNASAGILGGFCVSRCDPETGAYMDTIGRRVPGHLRFVVASPGIELLTIESRGALPKRLRYFDAVASVNSAAYFAAAFMAGKYDRLGNAGGDRLHEPYRLPKIPGAGAAIAAGIAAGAHAGWLSGSGSSVLCVAEGRSAASVGTAMRRAFAAAGVRCVIRALAADNTGLKILS